MKQEYIKLIDYLNMALRRGLPTEPVKAYIKNTFGKQDTVIDSILVIFENVLHILDELKVSKDSKDKVKYLSHTTKLPVFTKYLVPINSEGEPELGKLHMYHIAYANDPTEGTVLLDHLGIAHEPIKSSANIPYVMVASFCGGQTPEALDRLPIWSMYGDDAKGIALLFQTEDLAYSGPEHALPRFSSFEFNKLSDDSKQGKVATVAQKNKESTEEAPPQILYKVRYIDSSNQEVDGEMKEIRDSLKQIKEKEQQIKEENKNDLSIYHKCLELLNGIRYLIKDKSYAHEQEYRFVCFAGTEHIPEILKREVLTEPEQEPKDTQDHSRSRIYVETDILKKLCAVLTAPKIEKGNVLDIQYILHWYTKSDQFLKPEQLPVYTSSIPYR